MPISSRKESILFYGIGLAAVVVYGSVIYTHAINMPKWDDFPDILQFMDRWLNARSVNEKISVFFYHTNEHILLVNHIIILAQYYLLGRLDFSWLIYIGNLFYLGSSLVLWWFFREKQESAFAFSVLMLIGLSFFPYESTLWAMTAISNQAVIFFSFLALWLCTRHTIKLPILIPVVTLAIFSQSNGFLLLPLIGILLKKYHSKNLIHWMIFCISIIAVYIIMFNSVSISNRIPAWPSLPLENYLLVIPIFFASFGGSVFNESSTSSLVIATLAGLLITGLSWKQLQGAPEKKFPVFVLLFLGLSIASIACYRGLIAGPTVIYTSRYKMYGVYFLCLGLLLGPQWLKKIRASITARYFTVASAGAFFLASFFLNLPKSVLIDNDLRESLEHWVEDGDFRHGRGYFIKDSDSYLFAALHNGIWSPEVLIREDRFICDITALQVCPESVLSTGAAVSPLVPSIKHINRNAPGIRLEIPASLKSTTSEWLLYLCGNHTRYQLRFTPQPNETGVYPVYYIPAASIEPDHYTAYFLVNGQVFRSETQLIRKAHTR